MIEDGFYVSSDGVYNLDGLVGVSVKTDHFDLNITLHFKKRTIKIVDSLSKLSEIKQLKHDFMKIIKDQRNAKKSSEIDYLRQKVESYQDEVSNVKFQLDAFVQMFGNSTDK